MKKIWFAVFYFFFVPLLLYSQTYKWNKVDEISITLPDDWQVEKKLDSFKNEILKFRHTEYKNFTITLTYKKLINFDSSRHMAKFDANFLKSKDYVIMDNSPRHINRIPAYGYVYQYYDTLYKTFDKDYFTMRKIYIIIGKKYYSFIFSCPSVYYKEYQNILTKIIDNFTIKIQTDETGKKINNN